MKSSVFTYGSIALIFGLLTGCDGLFLNKKKTESAVRSAGLIVLDVNEPAYYADAHITGAQNVNYDDIEKVARQWDPAATTVVVYCTNVMCIESTRVAQKLQALGFKDVFVYKGGIHEWYLKAQEDKDAYPYESSNAVAAQLPYLKKPLMELEVKKQSVVPVITAADLSNRLKKASK